MLKGIREDPAMGPFPSAPKVSAVSNGNRSAEGTLASSSALCLLGWVIAPSLNLELTP